MKKIVNQHGDVLMEKVVSIPKGAKQVKEYKASFVIERGEGVNEHTLVADSLTDMVCDLIDIYEHEGQMYVRVKKGKQVKLTHSEHGTQILKEGIYRKVIEREYSYEQNEERRVID
jgi:hypothetical protein